MKNILAITYWSFKEPVFQSGALPYLRMIAGILPKGSNIYVFTLEKREYEIDQQEKNKITSELKKLNIYLVSKKYHHMGLAAFLNYPAIIVHLIYIILFKRITSMHAWCTPAGMISYLLSIITARPFIIDSYEPHAETMVETGNWKKNSLAFKILFFFEKLQSKKAHAVISLSSDMKIYAKEKYNTSFKRYHTRPTCVDFNLFDPKTHNLKISRAGMNIKENDVVCIYSGKLGGIYLKDEIFEFFQSCIQYWGDSFKAILLSDEQRPVIVQYLNKYLINEKAIISLFAPHNIVKDYLALADFAICPVKPIPTKRYCSPIKTGEYWAMGLPVIIPDNIGDDSHIIEKNKIGAVLHKLDKQEYISAIEKIDEIIHSPAKQAIHDKIISTAKQYRDIRNTEEIYKTLYSRG